jgi:hypothetical protein
VCIVLFDFIVPLQKSPDKSNSKDNHRGRYEVTHSITGDGQVFGIGIGLWDALDCISSALPIYLGAKLKRLWVYLKVYLMNYESLILKFTLFAPYCTVVQLLLYLFLVALRPEKKITAHYSRHAHCWSKQMTSNIFNWSLGARHMLLSR